ncbi:MAG: lipoate--protein ligase family protein [Candidatus Omnitrophota bacterium]
MTYWRFIDSGSSNCYTNMAIDEAIFTARKNNLVGPTLRFYGWEPAAFSFGYSQIPEKEFNLDECSKRKIDFVRRLTGGGIIYHNKELTYSISCRQEEIGADSKVKESYKKICAFLIHSYRKLGLSVNFSCQETGSNSFCFAGREFYDIVINGKKIGGNAQKRSHDLIFQHGVIPLELDFKDALACLKNIPIDFNKNTCALKDVLFRAISLGELKKIIKASFEEIHNCELIQENLTNFEFNLLDELKEKYAQTAMAKEKN